MEWRGLERFAYVFMVIAGGAYYYQKNSEFRSENGEGAMHSQMIATTAVSGFVDQVRNNQIVETTTVTRKIRSVDREVALLLWK
jgi:hypothetical protein